MNPGRTTSRSKIAFLLAFILCEFLAVCSLLAAVAFGIERGDLNRNPHVQIQDELRLNRAGDLATLGYIVLEIAATSALLRIVSRGTISRASAAMRAALVFIGLGVLSYAFVVAALKGFALDPLISVERTLARWVLAIVG